MKGKFYASGDLKQLESTLKEHEPYAVLVVSTTGIDKENEFEGHFPTRVVMKQFEFDDETKSYQSGFTFDKLVQAPQEAIQEALKNESSYDVFANGGIDKEAYLRGENVLPVAEFQKEFQTAISAVQESNATLIINNQTHAFHFMDKIQSADTLREIREQGKTLDQVNLTRAYFRKHDVQGQATLEAFHHRTDSKATWSKVDEAKMSNVIALQESCARSIAKNHPDEKIIASVYETTPKKKNHNKTYTFLNVVKDEGKGEENPKLSISFNSDGTPLTINYNNQFAYNIAARTTSENYHTILWNDPAFRELYNIAVDALQEQGLDRGILKFGDVPYEKQETAKPESSYTAIYTAVPLEERGLTKQDMDSWIPLHEKNDAKIINQLALSAIRNGSISMKEIKQETKGHTIKTKQALDALVKLGVVSESLKHESLMSEEDYAKAISDLARNPQARAEFASLSNSDAGQNNFTTYLTDSYEDACQYDWNPYLVLNKTEYGLADVVMSAIETRLNNGHDSIDLAKLQRLTGKSSQEASNIMVELERMGIVEGENDKKILVSSDDIAHLKEVALQHEMSHDMGTLEYAEAITELVMETIEKGSISVDDIIINPSMAEKNVNANSAIHTLEELGVISGDDAHTCLVTQEEYAQKFKEGNSDAFTNLLAISYAEYTREEKADRDESIPEKTDSKEEISSPTEPEHDEIPEMPPFDEHDPYEDYPEQEDAAFDPNYPSDELPEDPYSDVEDNFQFENMPEPPEEPDMNNDLDMSLD